MTTRDLDFAPGSLAGPLDPATVARYEQMLAHPFDPAYREHLARYNGGRSVQRVFDFDGTSKVVDNFLCVIPDYKAQPDHAPYDVAVTKLQLGDRLDENLVPFALLFPGDYLCFDYSAGDVPSIVWWDHEASTPGKPVVEPVADNFTAFLALLRAD